MLLEVYRCRRRAAMLGGIALLALLNALPPASAQDQPPTNPPAQPQAPQEFDAAFSVSPGAVGPATINTCTDALTANKRWWKTIASNQHTRSQKTCATRRRAASRASENSPDHRAASLAGRNRGAEKQ